MIIALEKMKFDNFLKSNGISKPNEDGYYTDHYTILNPKIAICIIDRKYVPLQPKTIKERK